MYPRNSSSLNWSMRLNTVDELMSQDNFINSSAELLKVSCLTLAKSHRFLKTEATQTTDNEVVFNAYNTRVIPKLRSVYL